MTAVEPLQASLRPYYPPFAATETAGEMRLQSGGITSKQALAAHSPRADASVVANRRAVMAPAKRF